MSRLGLGPKHGDNKGDWESHDSQYAKYDEWGDALNQSAYQENEANERPAHDTGNADIDAWLNG